ncbi:hypothetical protein [Deinococcus arboris]|uniref:hypothetical protein n=1 Tax=Deinococcus arboris TaxID=2682977 RepID=UPI0018DE5952|nr:hypothetical protein [Deinococcus arboris]
MRAFLTALTLLLPASAHAATLDLHLGQTGQLGSRTLTLLRVQDSRCPINARCVRAGELQASVLVTEAGRTRLLRLVWPEPGNQPAVTGVRVSRATDLLAGSGPKEPLVVTFSDEPAGR